MEKKNISKGIRKVSVKRDNKYYINILKKSFKSFHTFISISVCPGYERLMDIRRRGNFVCLDQSKAWPGEIRIMDSNRTQHIILSILQRVDHLHID